MGRAKDAKEKILQSAYDLFERNGYEHTTVEEIITASGYSKGTFYHYFSAKEELLLCWITTFDDHYRDWYEALDEDISAWEKLEKFYTFILDEIEFDFDPAYVSAIFSAQITSNGQRILAKKNRDFVQILHAILKEGQQSGEIRNDMSFMELAKVFMTLLNGIVYEWCAAGGTFSLREFGSRVFVMMAPGFRHDYN